MHVEYHFTRNPNKCLFIIFRKEKKTLCIYSINLTHLKELQGLNHKNHVFKHSFSINSESDTGFTLNTYKRVKIKSFIVPYTLKL